MQIFLFFSLMPAAKAQASLCIGKNSTEPSLFKNATNTEFPGVFFLSFNASSESSGGAVHWHKLDGAFFACKKR